MEAFLSYLAAKVARGQDLRTIRGLALDSDTELVDALDRVVREAIVSVELPPDLIERHAGISPLSMERLLDEIRAQPDPSSLRLDPPEADGATDSYVRAIARCVEFLGAGFGNNSGRQFALAILLKNWMRGLPLSTIISYRLQFRKQRPLARQSTIAAVIRETLDDVEQIARFEAPKYVSCYVDILRFHEEQLGSSEPELLPDISMLLELGVSRITEVSLMTLGLSRTSAVALSPHILADALTPAECRAWIASHDLATLAIPELVRREIEGIVERE